MEESLKTLENAAKLAGDKGLVRFTRFLDPAQAALGTQLARDYRCCFSSWGGYPDAERSIGCFHPFDEMPLPDHFPLVCLHSRYSSKFCSISHRDLLGAFMALGLTRSCIGDIIIVESDIYLFADQKTAPYISESMNEAGKVPLRFSVLSEIPAMPAPEGTTFTAIVSSLRLDAVLAAAYRLSRSEAADLIHSGLVKVDHIVCDHVDFNIREGSLLSVRGKGRIRFTSLNGLTKKQRIGITLFRYL